MSIANRLRVLLEENDIAFEVLEHDKAFTAQEEAAAAHVPGRNWAKTVVVLLDGTPALAVLPATQNVDLDALGQVTGTPGAVELATEDQFREIYPDCELGAMPPFGHLYGQTTFVEERLRRDEYIVFHAGNHETAIRLPYGVFEELEKPVIARFSES